MSVAISKRRPALNLNYGIPDFPSVMLQPDGPGAHKPGRAKLTRGAFESERRKTHAASAKRPTWE